MLHSASVKMMRRPSPPGCWQRSTLVALALVAAPAAGARDVVPLAPAVEPAVTEGIRDRFHDAVARGAGKGVLPASQVRDRLTALPHLAQCTSGACVAAVAATLQAEAVLTTKIERKGKNYTIRVQVLSPAGAELGKAAATRCEICTMHEAEVAVEKAAGEAMAAQAAAPSPTPAAPAAGGAPALPTSSSHGVEDEGPEALRESSPSTPPAASSPPAAATFLPPPSSPTKEEATTPSREAPTDDLLAPAVATTKPADSPSHLTLWRGARISTKFPYRLAGIVSFAASAALLIPTIVFSVYGAKDSQPTCDKADPVHSCPEIYSGNTGPAIALGVFTALGAVAGGLLFYFDYRVRHMPRITLSPSSHGIAAAANFSF